MRKPDRRKRRKNSEIFKNNVKTPKHPEKYFKKRNKRGEGVAIKRKQLKQLKRKR